MSKLNKKVALITGGGSGIGEAVARLFLQEGARVAIAGRNKVKLDETARALGGEAGVLTVACDVGDARQVQAMVAEVQQRLGNIDILVNNAGMNIKDRLFRQLTPEIWQQMVRTNLDGAFYCTHAVFPSMAQRQGGLIINISSVAGKRANPLGGIAYCASKFGMTALGIGLAAEEKDSGVRVTNIYPGEVDTPILEVRPTPVSDEHRAKILKPEDVASAVLFVATLPPHAHVPELIIKPTTQVYI